LGIQVQPTESGAKQRSAYSSRDWLGVIGILASLAFIIVLAIQISQRPFTFVGDFYHVLACQMVAAGRKPYVDFFIQQAPLYALVCGAWMRIFGSSLYAANLLSALLVCGSATIITGIASQIYSETGWGVKGGIVALLLFGLNGLVAQAGDTAQPYALCMFFCLLAWAAAFVGRPTGARSFASGLAAGAAVNTTLLSFPFLLILTGWSVFHTARPDRYRGLLWLLCGAAVASIPLAYLAILAPSQAWFGIVEYHVFYRGNGWTEITRSNLREILEWTSSPQPVLLVFLSLTGLPFLFDSKTPTSTRYSLQFAALIASSWALFLVLPRPTFFFYYVLMIPYVCLLGSAGLWVMAVRMWSPRWASIILVGTIVLYSLSVIRPFVHNSLSTDDQFAHYEKVARMINAISGPNEPLYADDEAIYVFARRLPPRGLENRFEAALRLSPEEYARAGLVPPERIEAQLRAGSFATVVLTNIDGNERYPNIGNIVRNSQLYSEYAQTETHVVFSRLKLQPAKEP
jgi:hypothetical protein